MEKYIDMTVCGTKSGLHEVLKESGLKRRLLEGDFSNGKVFVSVKQISDSYSLFNNYSLGISSKNEEEAINIHDLILKNKYRKIFGIRSDLYKYGTPEMHSGTGTGMGVSL
jgi:hypothetical protein